MKVLFHSNHIVFDMFFRVPPNGTIDYGGTCVAENSLLTRLSCSLKMCGGISAPSNASSPRQLGWFLSYLAERFQRNGHLFRTSTNAEARV